MGRGESRGGGVSVMEERKQQRVRVMGRMKRGGFGGGEWRVKKLLSGCENAAQPKRLSLE